jgi:hypothetical protein
MTAEERQNGIPITALREISLLRSLRHANIVNVLDVAVEERAVEEVYMVMEYAEQVGEPSSCFLNPCAGSRGASGWLIGPLPSGRGLGRFLGR